MQNINTTDTTVCQDLAVIAALDAMESGHALAPKLMIGLPCTVSIGADDYAYKIVAVSPSLKTITVEGALAGKIMVFRLGARGYKCAKHFTLTLGEAIEKRDPSF